MTMALITISRNSGSLGDELAYYLGTKLVCPVITREYAVENFFEGCPAENVARLNESAKFYMHEVPETDHRTYRDILIENLNRLADESADDNLIILGIGGCIVLGDRANAVNVRVTAGEETRCTRTCRRFNISRADAEAAISVGDRRHKRFVSILFEKDLSEDDLFDITINTDRMSVEEAGAAIIALAGKHDARTKITEETSDNDTIDHQSAAPVFKNNTEEEFARVLDMYNIEWMYEPKTFPIEWDAEGNVTMAFSPDFYLPKFNMYLELTTMDQKYVTKKNKKMRMVRELYPGTNIRIVYKKDFQELVERLRQFGG